MTIINIDELSKLRKDNSNKKIVFASGSFDLTHAGHVLFFEDCKKYGDILVVAVGSDKVIRQLKGEGRPILNQSLRLKIIDSLKVVDYTILDEITTKEDPHAMFKLFFEKLKPDIYMINEDVKDVGEREKLCKQFNIKMILSLRECPVEFGSVSTTKIIERVKKL